MWGLSAGIRSLHNKVRCPEVETISRRRCAAAPVVGMGQMIEQIDGRAKQPSQVACFSKGLKC